MPEQHLHRPDIDAALQEMSGEAVAQAVDLDLVTQSGTPPRAVECLVQRVARDGASAMRAGKDPDRILVGSPEGPQSQEQGFRQRYDPFAVPLADDADLKARPVLPALYIFQANARKLCATSTRGERDG